MKKICFTTVCAVLICIASACKNPPVFAAIEQEVKLKPASIKGYVRGIVCINNTLYASNGQLFSKTLGDRGKWSLVSAPAGFCTSIATDGSHLYAAFADGDSFAAYIRSGSSWMRLGGDAGSAQAVMGTEGTVFAIKKIDPKNAGYIVSALSGGGIVNTHRCQSIPLGAACGYYVCQDGLYDTSGVQIIRSPGNAGIKGICKGPNGSVFIFTETLLYNSSWGSWIRHTISKPQSIAYLPSRGLILIGNKTGYGELQLTGGRIQAGSAHSSIPYGNLHQYDNSVGKHLLNPIAAFDYGSGYIIYAGVNDSNANYTGLWGFYNPGQIEWNRE